MVDSFRILLASSALLLLAACGVAHADTLVKANGERLVGKILDEQDGYVIIEIKVVEDGVEKTREEMVFRRDIAELLRDDGAEPGVAEGGVDEGDQPAEEEPPAAPAEAGTPAGDETVVSSEPEPTHLDLPLDLPESARKSYEEGVALLESAHEARDSEERARLAEASIAPLTRAYRKVRGFPQAYYQLGIAYQLVGFGEGGSKDMDRKAEDFLRRALRLDEQFFEAMVELGDVLNRLEDFEEAKKQYDAALAIHPGYQPAYRMRGSAAMSLRRFEEAKADLEKAVELDPEDEYAKAQLERVNLELTLPWKEGEYWTHVSKHYEVVTNVSEEFAKKIADTAEEAYELYDILFAGRESRDMLFRIMCFRNMKEYVEGPPKSPPNSGGYYSPDLKKLVLFSYPQWEDTLNVINHEGFHQYLHMYLEGAPQWFNEGHGDFFGFASRSGKQLVPRPNAWRLRVIQDALKRGKETPIGDLLQMSQRQMYNPTRIGVNYAEAWSFVYFLWTYEGGVHRKFLASYFNLLRKDVDIEEAYRRVFARSIDKLESQWKTYTRGLELFAEDIELLKRKKQGTGIGE